MRLRRLGLRRTDGRRRAGCGRWYCRLRIGAGSMPCQETALWGTPWVWGRPRWEPIVCRHRSRKWARAVPTCSARELRLATWCCAALPRSLRDSTCPSRRDVCALWRREACVRCPSCRRRGALSHRRALSCLHRSSRAPPYTEPISGVSPTRVVPSRGQWCAADFWLLTPSVLCWCPPPWLRRRRLACRWWQCLQCPLYVAHLRWRSGRGSFYWSCSSTRRNFCGCGPIPDDCGPSVHGAMCPWRCPYGRLWPSSRGHRRRRPIPTWRATWSCL